MFAELPVVFLLLSHLLTFAFAKSSAGTNSTSYISIRTKDEIDYRLSSSLDVINHATMDQPIVVFEFEKFKIIDSMTAETNIVKLNQYQFLTQFFENHLTNVLDDEPILERPNSDKVAFFKIKNIEQSGSNMLYDFPVEDYNIIWFKFTKKSYDLAEINDFIESASIFLEEYLNVNIDMLINTKDTIPLEDLDEIIVESKQDGFDYDNTVKQDESSSKGNKDDKETEGQNDDSLSKTWTEGLIMCLVVSLLLLGILVVAMSWITSIEISYSALDKPTNPIKKTQ